MMMMMMVTKKPSYGSVLVYWFTRADAKDHANNSQQLTNDFALHNGHSLVNRYTGTEPTGLNTFILKQTKYKL